MEISVRDHDEVWTTDDYMLGAARFLHYRPPDEVNPDEQLYAAYLEVVSFELGDDYFIPTDYMAPRHADDERVRLVVSMREVMERTWSREPDFVVGERGRKVRLGEAVVEG